jgi:hypothetical protein
LNVTEQDTHIHYDISTSFLIKKEKKLNVNNSYNSSSGSCPILEFDITDDEPLVSAP